MANKVIDGSRRRFLVMLGGFAVGAFALPNEPTAAGIPSEVDLSTLPLDALPEAQATIQLATSPVWRSGIRPTDGETVDVLVYELADGESTMWWPADDEELAEMHRFYDATRTPGRPLVDPETIFPIKHSPEERKLLDAIVARLDDNEPRLAYAKWLERQSDPRGEFIRLQCSSHATGEREQQLLDEFGKRWLLPLAAIGIWPVFGTEYDPQLFFLRGMVENVILFRRDVLPAQAERLFAAAPALVRLTTICDLDVAGLAAVRPLRQLRSLRLMAERVSMQHREVVALANSPNLGGLRELAITHALADESVAVLCNSPTISHLHELDLHKCWLSAQGVSMVASSPRLASVKALHLGSCKMDVLAGRRLAESPSVRRLETLSFAFHDRFHRVDFAADALRAMLAGEWPCLRTLDLSQCRLGDDGARAIAESPGVAQVEELILNNTEINDDGVLALVHSPYLNKLRNISVPHREELREQLVGRLQRNAGIG